MARCSMAIRILGLILLALPSAYGCVGTPNNVINGGEPCDGSALNSQTCQTRGFTGGSLSCVNCAFVTTNCSSCVGGAPNNAIASPEVCDGAQLGGQNCSTQGFTNGTLTCTTLCRFNTSNCTGPIPTPAVTPAPVAATPTAGDSGDDLPLILGIAGGVGLLGSLCIALAASALVAYALNLSKKERAMGYNNGYGGNFGGNYRGVSSAMAESNESGARSGDQELGMVEGEDSKVASCPLDETIVIDGQPNESGFEFELAAPPVPLAMTEH